MAREVSQATLARRGLLVIVAVAVLAAFVQLRSNGTFGTSPHVVAHVADAGGALQAGSDVKVDGVIVGRVHAIESADEGGVDIDIEMGEDHLDRVPGNVVARVLPATVFGTTFVDLVVHGEPAGRLEAGASIAPDQTQGTLELQQALDDIDRLVEALGPAELASAIGSAAQALDGRGAQLRATLASANDYLERLNPRMPQVRADLEKLAANAELADEIAPDLLDAAEDTLTFLDVLVSQEAQLTTLLTGARSLTVTGRKFVAANQDDLVRFINDSAVLVDALYDNRKAGITGAITENIRLGQTLPTVIEKGYVRTEGPLRLNFAGDLDYYDAGDRPSYREATFAGMGGGS
ncbi:MCE family protein [Nocardioides panacisoli]|uniref:MCE family protein n=1 Tax=Nocardioides panacisoli TaxID=627624 RepID=UPI001C629833|nr:MCE family protein [Nocardioides panacisoli]QYJ04864.1 MCE family protein [Nocardioides panacisoli]